MLASAEGAPGSLEPVPSADVEHLLRELERLTGMTRADANGLLVRGRCVHCSEA